MGPGSGHLASVCDQLLVLAALDGLPFGSVVPGLGKWSLPGVEFPQPPSPVHSRRQPATECPGSGRVSASVP